jgi:hypothetical protein
VAAHDAAIARRLPELFGAAGHFAGGTAVQVARSVGMVTRRMIPCPDRANAAPLTLDHDYSASSETPWPHYGQPLRDQLMDCFLLRAMAAIYRRDLAHIPPELCFIRWRRAGLQSRLGALAGGS